MTETSSEPRPVKPCADLAGIKLLTCDIDGVQTDGGLFYLNDGNRMVRFHVLDGQGLKLLQKTGVKICFITQSTNDYIKRRASDLGVDYCFTGIDDKSKTIEKLAKDLEISLADVCHIADDINDISLLRIVGVPVTVPASVPEVKRLCKFETRVAGGQGAVRELCDAIRASQDTSQDAQL